MVAIVTFIRVESLSGVLIGDRVWGVLRRRGLVVLVTSVTEPSAIVVLWLLLSVVVVVLRGAVHHPTSAIAGL